MSKKVLPSLESQKDIQSRHIDLLKTFSSSTEIEYQSLFDTLVQGIVFRDNTGKIIAVNKAAEEILGVSEKNLIGHTAIGRHLTCIKEDGSEFPTEEHPSMVALRTGRPVRDVVMGVLNPQKKQYRWLSFNAIPLYSRDNKVLSQVYVSFTDITDFKHSEELLDMRLRLQQAVSALSQKALAKHQLTELFNDATQQLINILGVDLTNILEILPQEEVVMFRAGYGWQENVQINKTTAPMGNYSFAGFTLASKKPVILKNLHTETRFERHPVLLQHNVVSGMSVILYRNKGPYGVLCVFTTKKRTFTTDDISYLQSVANILSFAIQQNEVEHELIQNERRFRHLAEAIPQIIWIANSQGKMMYLNRQWYDYTGLTVEESSGDGWNKVVHQRDRTRAWHSWINSIKTGQLFQIEYQLKEGKTGQYRWFLGRAVPIKDETGNITRWFGTCTDIHDQKQIQQDLEKNTALTDAILQSLPSHVIVLDNQGTILAVNDALKTFAFENTTLYPSEVSIGNNYLKVLTQTKKKYGESITQIRYGIEAVLNKELKDYSLEYSYQRGKDESWFLMQVAPLKYEEAGIVVSHTDITDRKKLEKQKDDFMSIASHELKTPLTSLKAYGQVMLTIFKRKNDQQSVKMLTKMDAQLNKLTDIISDFLDVARIESGKLQITEEWFSLNELIEEVKESMQLTSKSHTLFLNCDIKCRVLANKDRIEQVLINLISNAIKYSPQADRIDITCHTDEENIVVSVRDYGIGIPREKYFKIFERFYRVSDSNKPSLPGLGLGLYISSEIIKLFEGKIWIEPAEEKGSIFFFSLPRKRVEYIHHG